MMLLGIYKRFVYLNEISNAVRHLSMRHLSMVYGLPSPYNTQHVS